MGYLSNHINLILKMRTSIWKLVRRLLAFSYTHWKQLLCCRDSILHEMLALRWLLSFVNEWSEVPPSQNVVSTAGPFGEVFPRVIRSLYLVP